VGSVESHRVYYKGEGGGFPQVRAVVSLVCPCCLWLVLAPRVFQLYTNHFVWVVCRPVWVTKACQLFLVPSRNSNPPLYPSKGCELGSVLQLLIPLLYTWAHIWIPWGVRGASTLVPTHYPLMCPSPYPLPTHLPMGMGGYWVPIAGLWYWPKIRYI